MNDSELCFRIRACFSGRVQGVGFRFTTLQLAKGFDVTGMVRNLDDGRVELEAEGEEPECRQLLASVQEELESFIQKTELSEDSAPRRHRTFRIA